MRVLSVTGGISIHSSSYCSIRLAKQVFILTKIEHTTPPCRIISIIYRSHICDDVSFKSLESMVAAANERNGQADVTGSIHSSSYCSIRLAKQVFILTKIEHTTPPCRIILYRSHICDDVSFKSLESMVAAANERNGQADVTGILLFNGHFSR
jgi:hypothetical protein